MIGPPPSRHNETQDLINRFREKRARRRRLRITAAVIGVVVFLGAISAGLAFALSVGSIGTTVTSLASATTVPGSPGTPSGSAPSPTPPNLDPTGSTTQTTSSSTTATTAKPTTTSRSTTTSTLKPTTTTKPTATTGSSPASSYVVVIDPGHQARGNSALEPIGPGSSQKKAKVSSGTAGIATGISESELVLVVGLKLRDALQAQGVEVVMTRTSQDVDISNIERAQIANRAEADLFVRIHADGSDNTSTKGIHVLYPAGTEGWTDDISAVSKKAAALAQARLIAATGAKDRGIDARSDMTGFNWSDVPVILPEIGFMTNPDEDRLLASGAYQDKIVKGLTQAILEFLGVK